MMNNVIPHPEKSGVVFLVTNRRGAGLSSKADVIRREEPKEDTFVYTLVFDAQSRTWALENYKVCFTFIGRKSGWYVYGKAIDYLNETFPEGFPVPK